MADITVDRMGIPPATVRARDEPAPYATTVQRADEVGKFRAARTPGFVEKGVWSVPVVGRPGIERRFAMSSGGVAVEMFEQYLVAEGRALIMASPEEVRDLAQTLQYLPAYLPAVNSFESRFAISVPAGWVVTERVTLRRNGTNHTVIAQCTSLPSQIGPDAWRRQLIEEIVTGSLTPRSSPTSPARS